MLISHPDGYSAPEVEKAEREIGLIAKQKLEELLPLGSFWTIKSTKTEKFGRWLADVSREDGQTLSAYLIEQGYGLPWNGKGTRPGFDLTTYPLPRRAPNP